MQENGITLSVLAPRRIPPLFAMFEKAGGDLLQVTCALRFTAGYHHSSPCSRRWGETCSRQCQLSGFFAQLGTRQLPRKLDHIFRIKKTVNCGKFGVTTPFRHRGLHVFLFLRSRAPLSCRVVVVAKLNNCRVPSSASLNLLEVART